MLICMKSISSNLQYHFITLDGDWRIQRESIFSQKGIIHIHFSRYVFSKFIFQKYKTFRRFYHIAIKQFKIYVNYLSCKVMFNPSHPAYTASDTTLIDDEYCVEMMTSKRTKNYITEDTDLFYKTEVRNLYKSSFEYV